MQQNANDPDIYYHRAQLHFIKGEFAEAAKDYQKSIDLDPEFIFSHIQLGVTQYKMGSIASSMATFRRCMKNFDKVPDVYNYYGELLLDQGKYQEAIEKFESAIEMEKQEKPTSMNVLPLINKALAIFQEKSDFAEAEKLCQKALISKLSSILFAHMFMLTRPSRPRVRYRCCHHGPAPPAAGQGDRSTQVLRAGGGPCAHRRRAGERAVVRRGHKDADPGPGEISSPGREAPGSWARPPIERCRPERAVAAYGGGGGSVGMHRVGHCWCREIW